MHCPICGSEMEKGGIITSGVTAMWHPLREFDRNGMRRFYYKDGKAIGKSSIHLNQTRIPNAHFCEK